jgi:acetyl-CoA carboxylase biotin carboxyl carrier protein
MSKKSSSKSVAKTSAKTSKATGSASTKPEMKTSEIRDLIDFISKTGLNEVNIETKELKLHVKREPDQKVFKSSSSMPVVTQQAMPLQTPVPVATQVKSEKSESESEATPSKNKTLEIKSPMIGTFYRSSTPDTPPFVSVGDKISKGQTVCIIEAMKLFNEIESEVSGTVVRVLLENATPVEYDQVLFVVEPD